MLDKGLEKGIQRAIIVILAERRTEGWSFTEPSHSSALSGSRQTLTFTASKTTPNPHGFSLINAAYVVALEETYQDWDVLHNIH